MVHHAVKCSTCKVYFRFRRATTNFPCSIFIAVVTGQLTPLPFRGEEVGGFKPFRNEIKSEEKRRRRRRRGEKEEKPTYISSRNARALLHSFSISFSPPPLVSCLLYSTKVMQMLGNAYKLEEREREKKKKLLSSLMERSVLAF